MARKTDSKVEIEKVEQKAFAVLHDALSGKDVADRKGQLAIKALNLITRRQQLTMSRERLKFSMVKMFAQPEDMRKYVTSTQPEIKKLVGA